MHSKRPFPQERSSSERSSKRPRSEKKASEESKLPTYVAEKALAPIGPYFMRFFSLQDAVSVFKTSRSFRSLSHSGRTTPALTSRQHCLIQCVMATHSTYRGNRAQLKKDQVKIALDLGAKLKPSEFLTFWLDVLQTLQLLTAEKAKECKDEIGEASHQLEIVMHAAVFRVISNDNVVKTIIELWLKALTNTHPAACSITRKSFSRPRNSLN